MAKTIEANEYPHAKELDVILAILNELPNQVKADIIANLAAMVVNQMGVPQKDFIAAIESTIAQTKSELIFSTTTKRIYPRE